jgi:hypothetical protein
VLEKPGTSAVEPDENATLRYLDASRVDGPFGDLASVDVRGAHDEQLGQVEGVLIDPAERRLCFFVCRGSSGRNYLLPTDRPARIDPDSKSLQVDVDAADLRQYPEYRRASTPDMSDDDMLTAIFARRSA